MGKTANVASVVGLCMATLLGCEDAPPPQPAGADRAVIQGINEMMPEAIREQVRFQTLSGPLIAVIPETVRLRRPHLGLVRPL